MNKCHRMWLSLVIALLASACCGCRGVEPIPPDKQAFIGTWRSEVGITMEISADGTANIVRLGGGSGTEQLDINASDPKGFRVYFTAESTLELVQPLNIARQYTINEYPSRHDDRVTMSLNGVTLVKE